MPSDIVTLGGLVERRMGGLKESLKVFRTHHADQAGQLLNMSGIGTGGMKVEDENGNLVTVQEGQAVSKDEPRLPYVKQEWPKRVHHADGREDDVEDDKELAAMTKQGFRLEPYARPRLAVGSPEEEKAALKKELADLRTSHAELLDKLNKVLK